MELFLAEILLEENSVRITFAVASSTTTKLSFKFDSREGNSSTLYIYGIIYCSRKWFSHYFEWNVTKKKKMKKQNTP